MDRTHHDGRPLKWLVVLDGYTRKCLPIEGQQRRTSQTVQAALGNLVLQDG